jgi:hypothetical protein
LGEAWAQKASGDGRISQLTRGSAIFLWLASGGLNRVKSIKGSAMAGPAQSAATINHFNFSVTRLNFTRSSDG